MVYAITTAVAIFILISLYFIAYLMDRKFMKKINTSSITLMGMLIALIVILTNCIGNSGIFFNTRLMLGNFVLFLSGMMFGPVGGAIVGTLSWLIGLGFIQTFIHASILAMYVLYAMLGSLVFLFKSESKLTYVILVYSFLAIASFLMTFVAFPIAAWATVGGEKTFWQWMLLPKKFVVFPLDVLIEPLLIIPCFEVCLLLLKNNPTVEGKTWATRFGSLDHLFSKKRSKKISSNLQKTTA
ncbi:ECF transporter S component family protein [Mycoplasma yeatsii]|uniref:ECF transporter S component (Folate family) n=1 Tax=Mycoplasma yeatsii TaxID=51365 RepID=A0ABU0NEN3_9MOLU|nr:hypothetical protein [Mycoplasma yeatsii]MDQ0567896.1 ECF transporter S component (folate family) [Mycoplasma yeatsii]